MSLLLKIVLAIVAGVLTTSLLEYFGLFNHGIDVLLGFVVALVVFFSWDGRA